MGRYLNGLRERIQVKITFVKLDSVEEDVSMNIDGIHIGECPSSIGDIIQRFNLIKPSSLLVGFSPIPIDYPSSP